MLKHKDHFHGSDLEKIENIYHIKKEDIVSFSANVNPLGISFALRNTLAENLDAITIGTLMVLVPGRALTNAMWEIMAGDIISGVNRTAEALLTAAAIALGVVVALAVGQ